MQLHQRRTVKVQVQQNSTAQSIKYTFKPRIWAQLMEHPWIVLRTKVTEASVLNPFLCWEDLVRSVVVSKHFAIQCEELLKLQPVCHWNCAVGFPHSFWFLKSQITSHWGQASSITYWPASAATSAQTDIIYKTRNRWELSSYLNVSETL